MNPLAIKITLLLFLWIVCGCNHIPPHTVSWQLVNNWPQLPPGFKLGNPSGIGIDSDQHIVVFHRAGRKWPLLMPMPDSYITANTILIVDRETGKLLTSWGAGLFIMPHGLTVDTKNNIWVTDVVLQQVFKFSYDGKLLLQLGEKKVAGNDQTHFNRPTDVAVAADGSFYVSDGYRNSRVVKFSATGKYLFEWGEKGNGPGQFNIPHAVTLDSAGRVYVADRENSRIQVFDSNGKFLQQWKDDSFGKLYSVTIDQTDGNIISANYSSFITETLGSDIVVEDSAGKLLTRFGRSGGYKGPVCRYHDMVTDRDGNIYVTDILKNRVQKFRRVTR